MVTIAPHLNGPPTSANGGVAGGLLAGVLGGRAAVRFHAPVPLDTALETAVAGDGTVRVEAGRVHVATVRPWHGVVDTKDLTLPAADAVARAEAMWFEGPGLRHPYPTCYGCGPARSDGLGLRPGLIADRGVHATNWTPPGPGPVPAWQVWAVLDCASGGPALHGVEDDEVVVTGELAVDVHATVPAGAELVAVTRATARDARKTTIVGVLLDRATGIRLATSTSTWLTIPKALAP